MSHLPEAFNSRKSKETYQDVLNSLRKKDTLIYINKNCFYWSSIDDEIYAIMKRNKEEFMVMIAVKWEDSFTWALTGLEYTDWFIKTRIPELLMENLL